jgi:hypothetical protein
MENQTQQTPTKKTYQKVTEMTDSEKLSEIVWELKKQRKLSERILNNVLFFFWITIISLAIIVLSIALEGTGPLL